MNESLNECKRLKGIKEFNLAFQHPVYEEPVLTIDVEYIRNRIKFIQEELEELLVAAEQNDIVGVVDALLDIDYFNGGTVFGVGVEKEFLAGFDIVQKANMSKLCADMNEVNLTRDKYLKEGIRTTYKQVATGHFAVYNSETGKVMKSVSYVAPDLTIPFLKNQSA